VESTHDKDDKKILDIDHSIEGDPYIYTTWRKFIGETYNRRIYAYLIINDRLFLPTGEEAKEKFEDFGISDIIISKELMAKVGYVR
jgi:hypothetical protein